MTNHLDSLGPRGLTIEQQNEIAAIQSQAASQSLQNSSQRFSVSKTGGEIALYVGELSPNVNDAMLQQHFKIAKSVHVCRDRVSGKSLGYAYANFYRDEDRTQALDNMNYSLIDGKACRLMLPERDYSRRLNGTGNIFINNLPPTILEKEVHDTFSQWGNVLSCKLIKNPNATKCYGYVNYDTIAAAEVAINTVNGATLFNREIRVGHQIPKADREVLAEDQSRQRFTNLYVKNIALEVTEAELTRLFSGSGPVSSILIQRDERNNSKGFGFVNFENPEDAEAAVKQLNNTDYFGKKLFVTRAQKKSEREDELRRQHQYQQVSVEKLAKYQGVNLYVKNLADEVTDDILRKEFSEYGQIISAKVMKDEKSGASKGFGFVCFAMPEDATNAVLEMNEKKILSKEIYVALAQRKEDRRNYLEAQISQRSSSPVSPTQLHQPIIESTTKVQPIADIKTIPNELTVSTLEAFPPETQRQMMGERIYSVLYDLYPAESGKLTGMMLELEKPEIVHLINRPEELVEKAKNAIQVLQEYNTSLCAEAN